MPTALTHVPVDGFQKRIEWFSSVGGQEDCRQVTKPMNRVELPWPNSNLTKLAAEVVQPDNAVRATLPTAMRSPFGLQATHLEFNGSPASSIVQLRSPAMCVGRATRAYGPSGSQGCSASQSCGTVCSTRASSLTTRNPTLDCAT